MTFTSDCRPGCRCRCGQQGCGCQALTGMTANGCAYGDAGVRCRMCNGPARAQVVSSQIQGKRVGLVWCPRCDVPNDPKPPAAERIPR